VTALTCTEVREAAAEFALDILEPHERSAIAAHLLRCPACRAEVEAMSSIGTRLLELVPGTEPPLGFDDRVLARVRPDVRAGRRAWRRGAPRLFAGVAAAVAAVVLLVGSLSLGWFHGGASPAPRAVLTAQFVQGGRNVGEFDAYTRPAWLNMTVNGVTGTTKVTCELVAPDGRVTPVGSFDLVEGSGSWGAPDPHGVTGIAGARLVDSSGQVIATATIH
jgi:hypothetical protein